MNHGRRPLLFLQTCLLLLLVAAVAVDTNKLCVQGESNTAWTHDWSTMTKQMWVDFAGVGYTWWPSNTQWKFVAENYAIVSLEKCFATRVGKTWKTTIDGAKKLKSYNPEIKVLAYFNTLISYAQCYHWGPTFLANQSWWLKNDRGEVYRNNPSNDNTVWQDMTDEGFWHWFLNEITDISSKASDRRLVDGIFADQMARKNHPFSRMSSSRFNTWLQRQMDFANATRTHIHSEWASNSKFVANCITPDNGSGRSQGRNVLPYTDTACVEHFISHESLNQAASGNGSLYPKYFQQNVNTVKKFLDAGKNVVVKAWPGPIKTAASGWIPQSGYTTPTTPQGKANAAKDWLYVSLAAYLIIADEKTYFSYNWGWTAADGVWPCCDGSCAGPCGWYPELSRPLGKPLTPYGKRMPTSRSGPFWVYERRFENVHVVFNASDVRKSTLTWLTLTPTVTPDVTASESASKSTARTATESPSGESPTSSVAQSASDSWSKESPSRTQSQSSLQTETPTASERDSSTFSSSSSPTRETRSNTDTGAVAQPETTTATGTATQTGMQGPGSLAGSQDSGESSKTGSGFVPSSGVGRSSSDVSPIHSSHGGGSSSSQDHRPSSNTGSTTSSGMNTPSPMTSSGMNTPSQDHRPSSNTGSTTSMATPSPSSPGSLTSSWEPARSTSAASATSSPESSRGRSSKESAPSSPSASSDHGDGIVVTSSSMMSPSTGDEESSSSTGNGIEGNGGNAAAAGPDDSTPASVVAAAVVIPLILVALIVGIVLVVMSRRRRGGREANTDGLLLDGEECEERSSHALLRYEEMIMQQQEAKKGGDVEAEERPATFKRGGSCDSPHVREGELSGSNNPIPLPSVSPTSPLSGAGTKVAETEGATTTLFDLDALEDTVGELEPVPGLDAAATDQAMTPNAQNRSLPEQSDDDDSDMPPPISDDDDLSPVNLASSASDDLEMGDLDVEI